MTSVTPVQAKNVSNQFHLPVMFSLRWAQIIKAQADKCVETSSKLRSEFCSAFHLSHLQSPSPCAQRKTFWNVVSRMGHLRGSVLVEAKLLFPLSHRSLHSVYSMLSSPVSAGLLCGPALFSLAPGLWVLFAVFFPQCTGGSSCTPPSVDPSKRIRKKNERRVLLNGMGISMFLWSGGRSSGSVAPACLSACTRDGRLAFIVLMCQLCVFLLVHLTCKVLWQFCLLLSLRQHAVCPSLKGRSNSLGFLCGSSSDA